MGYDAYMIRTVLDLKPKNAICTYAILVFSMGYYNAHMIRIVDGLRSKNGLESM